MSPKAPVAGAFSPDLNVAINVDDADAVYQRPPVPAHLAKVDLTDNAASVLEKRYLRRGPDGLPVETIEEMFWRVAWHISGPESEQNRSRMAEDFYCLLTGRRFFPNSPTFTGAGTALGQLAACFVLPISDDMGRDEAGIFQTLRNAALIQQTGGGNGFSFSRLRQKGAFVKSSGGTSSGPVGFLKVYDSAFGMVAQGGCLLPDTLVFTSNGLLQLDEIVPCSTSAKQWAPHVLSVPTDEGIKNSPAAYNNGVAPCLKITTEEGYSVAGTLEHRIKRFNPESGLIEWATFDTIRPGDFLVTLLDQHQDCNAVPLVAPDVFTKHHNQCWPAQFPTELTTDLAFLLGYMCGNGFVASGDKDHRFGFSVPHSSLFMVDEIYRLLADLFGDDIKPHIQQKPDDASLTIVVHNRAIKDFLVLNELTKISSLEACIPGPIRRSGRAVLASFLQGLFEADGTPQHGYPSLCTGSEQLAREVQVALSGLGCPSRVFEQTPSASRYSTKPSYRLSIVSSRGLESWKRNIGCRSQLSRFQACMEWKPTGVNERHDVIPVPGHWLHDELLHCVPSVKKELQRFVRGDRMMSRAAAKRIGLDAVLAKLGNRFFTCVKSVDDIGDHETFDIEVSDNHTYLAGTFVSHNTRRGANMAVLRVDHPDIRAFIVCKQGENSITNFNISVGITDTFMRAVNDDTTYDLIAPHTGEVMESPRAREIWDLIVKNAYSNGEPGVLFLDEANRHNPVPHLYDLESTNPCGEQWLGGFENCCLGSINLAQYFAPENQVDWAAMKKDIILATRFLDNVVEANAYVPHVPQLREAAMRCRRIGLGIMGLADLMYHCRVRYGSEEGEEFAAQVMEWVRYWCMVASVELACERGPFPALPGSIYDPKGTCHHKDTRYPPSQAERNADGTWGPVSTGKMKWQPPKPLVPFRRNFGRPAVDWLALRLRIARDGIRNACQTTVAPTGTIATVAGCEGYGCEPVFALAYKRNVNDGDNIMQLDYVSPLFLEGLEKTGLDAAAKLRIVERMMLEGTCQNIKEDLPSVMRRTFVVSGDITAEEHVRMQAAIQAFVDNSMSKTCNLPEMATTADIGRSYMLAWKLGCKGITVYRTGSRDVVVLETNKEAERKKNSGSSSSSSEQDQQQQPTAEASPSVENETVEQQQPEQRVIEPLVVHAAPRKVPPMIVVGVASMGDSIDSAMEDSGSNSDEELDLSSYMKRRHTLHGFQPVESPTGPCMVPIYEITCEADYKIPRPQKLKGETISVKTPQGVLLVTVNEINPGEPFEVVLTVGKAGSDIAGVAEGIGRSISYVLRLISHISPRVRMRGVIDQLIDIGGSRTSGYGKNRVKSIPDAIAKVFEQYLSDTEKVYAQHVFDKQYTYRKEDESAGQHLRALARREMLNSKLSQASSSVPVPVLVPVKEETPQAPAAPTLRPPGPIKFSQNACPDCGNFTMLNEEGCAKCYTIGCAYSEC